MSFNDLEKALNTVKAYNKNLHDVIDNIKLNSNQLNIDRIISIYKIRSKIASDNENEELAKKMLILVNQLENSSKEFSQVRIASFNISDSIYVYYLNQELNKVLGSLEGKKRDNDNFFE